MLQFNLQHGEGQSFIIAIRKRLSMMIENFSTPSYTQLNDQLI